MNTQYTQTETAAEMINDLINIHNDRIAGYEQILTKVTALDSDIEYSIKDMISKAAQYKLQLAEKMNDISLKSKKAPFLFGKVYRAWVDLKMTFTGNTRRSVLSYCKYNEDIAQHAYNAALSLRVAMNSDLRLLIEQQQEALEKSYGLIKTYRDELNFSMNPRLVYFN